jgi:uncharacterized membrane protein YkoI
MMQSLIRLLAGALLVVLPLLGAGCEGRERGERERTSQSQLSQQTQITQDQARQTALASVPGTAQRVRLERDAGKVVYEVTVQPQSGGALTDVEVDATSGQVVKSAPARADDDDDDD